MTPARGPRTVAVMPLKPNTQVTDGTDNRTAISWILMSVVTSSAMTLAVRGMSLEHSAVEIVFLRASLTGVICILIWSLSRRFREMLQFSNLRLHALRGALIGVSTILGFYTIGALPLATVTVLFFVAPIFATVLSIFVQGERVGPRRWAAIGFGFLGAVIILRPGFAEFHPAMLAALASSFLFALALTLSRGLAQADGPIAAFTSSTFMTILVAAPIAGPGFSLPGSWWIWLMLAIVIVTGAMRSVGDIQAYRLGEASVVAPFIYLRLLVIGVAAYFLFDETPDFATLLGAVVIIASTLYIALRESRLRKVAAKDA